MRANTRGGSLQTDFNLRRALTAASLSLAAFRSGAPLQPGPAYLRPNELAAQLNFNLRRALCSSVAAAAGRPCGKLAPGIVLGPGQCCCMGWLAAVATEEVTFITFFSFYFIFSVFFLL